MKYFSLGLLSLCLFLFSCSSDPCADVPCENGQCVEGICECSTGFAGVDCSTCADGYYGENCDVTDFTGIYWMTSVSHDGCPDFGNPLNVSGPVSDQIICGNWPSDKRTCWKNWFQVHEDGTFGHIIAKFEEQDDGSEERTIFEIQSGSYVANNESIVFTSNEGKVQEFIIGQDQLTKSVPQSSGGTNCTYIEQYTKMN